MKSFKCSKCNVENKFVWYEFEYNKIRLFCRLCPQVSDVITLTSGSEFAQFIKTQSQVSYMGEIQKIRNYYHRDDPALPIGDPQPENCRQYMKRLHDSDKLISDAEDDFIRKEFNWYIKFGFSEFYEGTGPRR